MMVTGSVESCRQGSIRDSGQSLTVFLFFFLLYRNLLIFPVKLFKGTLSPVYSQRISIYSSKKSVAQI